MRTRLTGFAPLALAGLLLAATLGACTSGPPDNSPSGKAPVTSSTAPTSSPQLAADEALKLRQRGCSKWTKHWPRTIPAYAGAAPNRGLEVSGFAESSGSNCWSNLSILLQGGKDIGYSAEYLADRTVLRITVRAPMNDVWATHWDRGAGALNGLIIYQGGTDQQTVFEVNTGEQKLVRVQSMKPDVDDLTSDWQITIRVAA